MRHTGHDTWERTGMDLEGYLNYKEKWSWWIGIICSRSGPMVGFCKHGKESVGSVKCLNSVTSWTSSAFSRPLRQIQKVTEQQLRVLTLDVGLTAIWLPRELRMSYARTSCAGWWGCSGAHWSVSHSLISHHRTATIKQCTGLAVSLWSAVVA